MSDLSRRTFLGQSAAAVGALTAASALTGAETAKRKLTGAADRVLVISFDHVVLKRAVERHPHLRTEAITHARHADVVGVLRACGASSISIELDMFHPDDARALHEAGRSIRVHLPPPEVLADCWRGGRDIVPRVVDWLAEGLIDTLSGDDVPFLARLVDRAGGPRP